MTQKDINKKDLKHRKNVSRLPSRRQTVGEEIANSITHGIGALLSLAGLIVLLIFAAKSGDAWRIVSLAIYGLTLVILYTFSTLYHSFPWPRVKKIFRIFDHTRSFS